MSKGALCHTPALLQFYDLGSELCGVGWSSVASLWVSAAPRKSSNRRSEAADPTSRQKHSMRSSPCQLGIALVRTEGYRQLTTMRLAWPPLTHPGSINGLYCTVLWRSVHRPPIIAASLLDQSGRVAPSLPSREAKSLLRSARLCAEAAIRNTTVFDQVPRQIVTNVFGTLHA